MKIHRPPRSFDSGNRTRGATICLWILCLAMLWFGWVVSSTYADVTTDPVGYVTLTIRGHGGRAHDALSFLAVGLTRRAEYKGSVETAGASTIITDGTDWTDDQFSSSAHGTFYIEITSGAAAGCICDLISTDAAQKTLVLAADLSNVLKGAERFKIRRHWTLASLFGPNNEAGLGAGSNTTADEILLYDPTARVYTTYFYKTIGLGGTGWRSTASTAADQAHAKVDFARGFLIRRKQAGDLRIKVFGLVKTGDARLAVYPGLNIVPNVYPTDALTLENSNLYTGDPATGLTGGSNITADKILIYNGTTYNSYYYKTQGLGGTGWRSTASTSADAAATVIPRGASILIQRANDQAPFFWVLQQPF